MEWNGVLDTPLNKLVAGWIGFITFFFLFVFKKPVPLHSEYHNFADRRTFFACGCCCKIANGNDVLSNIPFALVSLCGIGHLLSYGSTLKIFEIDPPVFANPSQEIPFWMIFYVAVGLVSIGSSYYHLKPTSKRLTWDIMPMTVAFVTLTSIVLQETVCVKIPYSVFWLMVATGISTVLYWRMTDDLRPYILVQLGAIISIPICFGFWGSKYYDKDVIIHYMEAVLFYAACKVTELFDGKIYNWTGKRISGHTIKHLLASVASGWPIIILSSRSLKESIEEIE